MDDVIKLPEQEWRQCFEDFEFAKDVVSGNGDEMDSPEKAFILGWQIGRDRLKRAASDD